MASPMGAWAISACLDHCTRTGRPDAFLASQDASKATLSAPLCP
jgi:hypothetical protein